MTTKNKTMDMTPEEIKSKIKDWYKKHKHPITWTLRNQTGFSLDEVVELFVGLREYGELKQSPRELLERTWDAAVAITHWEERNAEWSKCTLPDKETFINSILSESPKEEAVEFAEWVRDNNYSQSNRNGKWYEYPLKDDDVVYYTTHELYNLFKQTK